eukprot:scaffold96075_cov31-Tisochrysis_lutea.AAC.5
MRQGHPCLEFVEAQDGRERALKVWGRQGEQRASQASTRSRCPPSSASRRRSEKMWATRLSTDSGTSGPNARRRASSEAIWEGSDWIDQLRMV